jgi:cell division septum initiation protein DivIVA
MPCVLTCPTLPHRLRRLPLALALALGAALASPAAFADEAALKAEIADLRAQIDEMKAQMKELAAQSKATPSPTATATPTKPAVGTAQAGTSTTTASSQAQTDLAARVGRLEQTVETQAATASETTIFGYGEIGYGRPIHSPGDTQADLARAVLGWSHRFDDRTRMAAELEVEHAVASSTDKGEVEVEQFYAERDFTGNLGGRAGLVLIPIGFLNEHHEPTQYYGVFRNFVETSIIPTTWREGALALYGTTDSGLKWGVGLTTGFNLANWDPSSSEGRESPLGSIHQELSEAAARDLSAYVSVNYNGIPGFQVGGTYFTGKAGQGVPDFAAPNARVTLWEAHARWQPGPFDFAALYARATISDTEALNLTFIGLPTPVPELFFGGYVQAAWRNLWSYNDYSFTPFTRYEWVNTAASYAPVPQGLGVPTTPTEQIWTIGANFSVTPSIVFKADYQQFKIDTQRNSVQLGFGLNF